MSELKWWQKAVFYQVYPRSFADSNGDGIGDLPGLTRRLDTLAGLGIDAIWLSPHYPSPQFDCGYDVSSYTDVAPEYGTLDDFQRFLDAAHARDIRVILDLVLNHTSNQHLWFNESASSRTHPRRDWYIWRDGKDGGPPNNWLSSFGGSAWTLEPLTGQYYYHFFFKEQPDLNWRNPEVKQAMFDVVRFWLDRGVDGFRLDAIGALYERPDLPDHTVEQSLVEIRQWMDYPSTPEERQQGIRLWRELFAFQHSQPEIHALFRELRTLVDEYEDRVLVGETEDIEYLGRGDDELHMVFNFGLMRANHLTPQFVRQNQQERLSALAVISPDAWPCNTLNNHDSTRVWTQFGDCVHDAEWARLSAALMLTLRGTPFLYNGEEIGMRDYYLEHPSQFRDLLGNWRYQAEIEELRRSPEEALYHAARYSRDRCRTPMQWSRLPNAGFSPPGVETWLPVNPNYAEGINVEDQQQDPASLWHFYRHMLHLRRSTPALVEGEYLPLHPASQEYLAFLRHAPQSGQAVLVVLNLSPKAQALDLDELLHESGFPPGAPLRLLFSSHPRPDLTGPESHVAIAPFEVFIAEIGGAA